MSTTLFFKPFIVRTQAHCYLSPHTVYSIVAQVQRGKKQVTIVLGEQISKPNLDQCLSAARRALDAHVISRKAYDQLVAAATKDGYRAPAVAAHAFTQHTPYTDINYSHRNKALKVSGAITQESDLTDLFFSFKRTTQEGYSHENV